MKKTDAILQVHVMNKYLPIVTEVKSMAVPTKLTRLCYTPVHSLPALQLMRMRKKISAVPLRLPPLEGCGTSSRSSTTSSDQVYSMATIPYIKKAVHDLRDLKRGKFKVLTLIHVKLMRAGLIKQYTFVAYYTPTDKRTDYLSRNRYA